MLADRRESGSIEQDADMVYFLNNADGDNEDTVEKKNVSLIIAKHRNGATGTIYYVFDKKHMRFSVAVNKKQAESTPTPEQAQPENAGDIAQENLEEGYYVEEEYAPVGEPDDVADFDLSELQDAADFLPPADEE